MSKISMKTNMIALVLSALLSFFVALKSKPADIIDLVVEIVYYSFIFYIMIVIVNTVYNNMFNSLSSKKTRKQLIKKIQFILKEECGKDVSEERVLELLNRSANKTDKGGGGDEHR